MQKFIGIIKETPTMKINSKMIEGYSLKQGEYEKTHRERTIKYFQNGNVITCIITVKNSSKGIGIAKCHPDDEFNLGKGVVIAELRARADFYKNVGEIYIKYSE